MLRITQSTREGVSSCRLKQLGVDLMSHVRSALVNHQGQPLINITPSLHAMCAHDWHLVLILDAPVAIYSEQAQEHWNKYLTKYKSGPSARERQHSVSLNVLRHFCQNVVDDTPHGSWEKKTGYCGKDTLANGMHLTHIKGKMRCMKVSIPIKLYSFFNIHSLFMYI